MGKLTRQPVQQIPGESMNTLLGAFQSKNPDASSSLEGLDSITKLGGNILNDGQRAQARAASTPGFDAGLAEALSTADGLPQDQEFSMRVQRSADKLQQKASQQGSGGSLSIRAEQISIARQYIEANPGRAREILNTFKLSTQEGSIGGESVQLLEDIETKQQAYEQDVLDIANEIDLLTFDKNGNQRPIPQIAADIHVRQAELDRNLSRIEASTNLDITHQFRREEVMNSFGAMNSSLMIIGEPDFKKEIEEFNTIVKDGKTFLAATPDQIAATKAKSQFFLNQMKSRMTAGLRGSGSQADVNFTFSPIEEYVNLQGQLLDGSLSMLEYDNRVKFQKSAAQSEMYLRNPNVSRTHALAAELGTLMNTVSDRYGREILGDVAGPIIMGMEGLISDFGLMLDSNGLSTAASLDVQKKAIDYISDKQVPDQESLDQLVRLMTSILPSSVRNPELFTRSLSFFADPMKAEAFLEALALNPNPGTRAQVVSSMTRQYDAAVSSSTDRIQELLSTPRAEQVLNVRPNPLAAGSPRASIQDTLRRGIRNLDESFLDSKNLNYGFTETALNNLTDEEMEVFEEARAELLRERRQILTPLRQAMINLGIAIKPERAPEEEKNEEGNVTVVVENNG